MPERQRHTALSALLSVFFVFAFAGAAFGRQGGDAKSARVTQGADTPNVKTVNAQQGGAWSVGLDPARTTVRLPKDGVSARLNAMPPSGFTLQAQVTFSGYLEDLPTAQ